MKRFVIGDIHGNIRALKQVIERSGINKEEDLLITLGDITDGHPYVAECVDELLTFKNRIDIIGNHDQWFRIWLDTGIHTDGWRQGGVNTAKSYLRRIDKEDMIVRKGIHEPTYLVDLIPEDIGPDHWKFFKQQRLYYKDEQNNVFVHGGFYRLKTLKDQFPPDVLYWDRELWMEAQSCLKTDVLRFAEEPLNKVFIGHTSTTYSENNEEALPLFRGRRIWNIDTGAGGHGKLTIMNVDTEEFFQSDFTKDLYETYDGR